MNSFLQSIRNLSPGRLASISAVFVFLIAFFIYIATSVSNNDYVVLYTDLDLADAKQIVSKLEEAKISFKLTRNGTEILVPVGVVNRMRVETADLALQSKGSNVGYEIFDNTDALGSTNFVQNVNLIRALEGELARTIRSVDNIQSARVHLVLPKREMFAREEQTPSASVVVRTKRGSLDLRSVQSIQKIVAAAVPKLDVKNVAIVDTAGNLLTDNFDSSNARNNATNELMRLEHERKMETRLNGLLEKIVGQGRARSKVTIDMDFDQVITNEEIFDPDSQVVRSSSTITEDGKTTDGERPVTVSQNIPNPDVVNNISGSLSQNSRTEETINYEISKVVRNKVRSNGEIRRISVAVMIDGLHDKGDGGEDVYTARTPQEMERIASIVRSAVGYDANRGDVVEVENIRFVSVDRDEIGEGIEGVLGFSKEDIIRIAEGLGVALVAILVILLVIRPLINNAFESSSQGGMDGVLIGETPDDDSLLISNFLNEEDKEIEDLININKIDGRIKASSLKRLNDIVEKNPDTAVNIIRNWLYQSDN